MSEKFRFLQSLISVIPDPPLHGPIALNNTITMKYSLLLSDS